MRYTAGKVDWAANALPVEGTLAREPRAIDVARRDVPRCRREERVDAIRARIRDAGWDRAVVVNDAGVVLGLLQEGLAGARADAPVETVMDPGPSTLRPSVLLDSAGEYFAGADGLLVTTPDGVLLGLLWRADAERAVVHTGADRAR